MGTSDYFKTVHGSDSRIRVIKADVGPQDWNLSHARNIGAKEAKGNVLVFIDADTILKASFLQYHISVLEPRMFICGTLHYVSGCCIVWKSDFEEAKGYNEVVEGWGSEDVDFYARLEKLGVRKTHFKLSLIRNMPHSDGTRNEYYGKANIYETNNRNYELMQKGFKSIYQ